MEDECLVLSRLGGGRLLPVCGITPRRPLFIVRAHGGVQRVKCLCIFGWAQPYKLSQLRLSLAVRAASAPCHALPRLAAKPVAGGAP